MSGSPPLEGGAATRAADLPVAGRCAEQFAPVRHEFVRNFLERGEVGAGLCILVVAVPLTETSQTLDRLLAIEVLVSVLVLAALALGGVTCTRPPAKCTASRPRAVTR